MLLRPVIVADVVGDQCDIWGGVGMGHIGKQDAYFCRSANSAFITSEHNSDLARMPRWKDAASCWYERRWCHGCPCRSRPFVPLPRSIHTVLWRSIPSFGLRVHVSVKIRPDPSCTKTLWSPSFVAKILLTSLIHFVEFSFNKYVWKLKIKNPSLR